MFPILLAVVEIMLDVMIQTAVVTMVIQYVKRLKEKGRLGISPVGDSLILARVMVMLFLGHVVQIASWAVPFRVFGEF